ncbi:MAG TPA: pyridoxal-phosphate dependent enzyme [Flavobacteriaceae bacterium]|nr:pyridoxal-phosphate dependent enzyme [Flavobacteriaceae bacterium]
MDEFFRKPTISNNEPLFKDEKTGISLYLKREDLLHPEISGNKFRKLKCNLLEAKKQGKTKLLTFGGAFSNHILATAAAGKEFGFETIGVIRGEELGENLPKTLAGNPTLKFAVSCGMKLFFLTREEYRQKNSEKTITELEQKFGNFYLLPEGGTNELAIKGCEEILSDEDKNFDYICCPVGTGGTLSGIIRASEKQQQILGFSALKGNFLPSEIKKFVKKNNWEIITNFNFGGYGKVNEELVGFINDFKQKYGVLLDPIYTGKMLFGVFDLIEKGFFKENTRILAVHTGGLQGISGMNKTLKKKGMTTIDA